MKRLTPREKDLGPGFMVRRTLPQRGQRMVGPFIFWDHMGPVVMKNGDELQVRAHPHIGLATVTYLFSGEIMHRDSLGNEQLIRPGEVNWMTAGKGIAHSERSQKTEDKTLEGVQVWVALPVQFEQTAPNFYHIKESELPNIVSGECQFRLIAGEALGTKSPVPVYSKLFYLHSKLRKGQKLEFTVPEGQQGAIYCARGAIKCNESSSKLMAEMDVYESGETMNYVAATEADVMILGGETFPEKRFIWWNLVASNKDLIEEAKVRWVRNEFGSVINETEWIPLPENG